MTLKKERTLDGSETYRNTFVGELYHTKSGAVTEATEKYAAPLMVWRKDSPVILDICFGLGYNSAAAIDMVRKHGNNTLIRIYCFENDASILREIQNVNPGFGSYGLIKSFVKGFLEKKFFSFKKNGVELKMLFGDATKEIRNIAGKADFAFLDPFSPKKQPGLWSLGFMKDINSAMKKNGLLATYSYARVVRDNLSLAGFDVTPGPVIGRRSPSTIARKR